MARAVSFAPSPTTDADRAVRNWLLGVAALVGLMVTIGGATRLTGSGLSITEWQPIMGAVPPIGEAAWLEAFAKYKTIPQYAELNKGMSLEAFKAIFWWEWGHRLLGRLIGIAFAVPLAWFWIRGRIRRELKLPLLGLLALGALQGFVGWFMVQSGLAERVSVSQYRLALHLAMAFLVLGGLLWLATGLDQRRRLSIRLRTITGSQLFGATLIVVLVFVQVIAGAFVAGLKAGLTYNTWPLMDGHVVPAGLATLAPWYMNLFENVTAVQFNHRVLAYLVTIAVLWHAAGVIRRADDEYLRATSLALVAVVLIQVAIGIWTLLWVVPLPLALLHQAGAALLFAIAVMHRRVAGWSRAAG